MNLKTRLRKLAYKIFLALGLRPSEIYVLTSVGWKKNGMSRTRTWNWFATKDEAIASAIKSADFYGESMYYPYIVIERVAHQGLPYDRKPTWLQIKKGLRESYEYINEDGSDGYGFRDTFYAEICEAPPQTRQIVGWGIG